MPHSVELKHRMLTEGTNTATLATMAAGATVSSAAAGVSYMDQIEQLFRMGASAISIASGLVVILIAIRNKKLKKEETKNEE